MYKILTIALGASLLLASCGSSSSSKNEPLAAKKAKLDSLKAAVIKLQAEVDKEDTAAGAKEKAKLVSLTALTPTSFTHYIDLQGNVDAENYSYVSPRGQGGVVRAVYVKQGDHVRQGQLLLKLDDVVQRQQIATAQTNLAYAKDLYNRR